MKCKILDWLPGWSENKIFKEFYLEIEGVFILALKVIVSG